MCHERRVNVDSFRIASLRHVLLCMSACVLLFHYTVYFVVDETSHPFFKSASHAQRLWGIQLRPTLQSRTFHRWGYTLTSKDLSTEATILSSWMNTENCSHSRCKLRSHIFHHQCLEEEFGSVWKSPNSSHGEWQRVYCMTSFVLAKLHIFALGPSTIEAVKRNVLWRTQARDREASREKPRADVFQSFSTSYHSIPCSSGLDHLSLSENFSESWLRIVSGFVMLAIDNPLA